MQKVNLLVGDKAYKSKPEHGGAVTNNFKDKATKKIFTSVSAEELAQLVGKGHSVILSTMEYTQAQREASVAMTEDMMIQQQVLALDFDNSETRKDENGKTILNSEGKAKKFKTTGANYYSLEAATGDMFINLNASFIYKTFSHVDGWDKFRVVFLLDKPLKSKEEVINAYKWLFSHFSITDNNGREVGCLADSKTTNANRIFYGGTDVIEINYNNILPVEQIPVLEKKKPVKKKKSVSAKNLDEVIAAKPDVKVGQKPTWKLIKEGNVEEVKERYSVYNNPVVSGKVQAVNTLKSINMADLLGLPFGVTFNDIFHEENTPSSGIFKMSEENIYLYKCHSSGEPFTGDIVRVVSKLQNSNYGAALKYLMEVTGMKIEMSEQIKELREQCDLFINLLLSSNLKKEYPAVHNRFWNYKNEIVAILTIFKENIYEDEDGNLRSLTWMSTRTISQKIYGTPNKKNTVTTILNLLSYTNWIEKLDEKDIPTSLLEKIKQTQNINKRSKRSNVFELFTLEDDFFDQLNRKCEVMKETGFSVRTISKEGLLGADGKEVADKVFVQDKKRGYSQKTENFFSDMCFVTEMYLKNSPYIEQNQILEELSAKWGKSYTEDTFRKMLPRMLKEKGYKKNRLTKSLIAKWGIEQTQSFPTVLYA